MHVLARAAKRFESERTSYWVLHSSTNAQGLKLLQCITAGQGMGSHLWPPKGVAWYCPQGSTKNGFVKE